jgi:16S rRNA (cytosine967-C5)-methyltransferase
LHRIELINDNFNRLGVSVGITCVMDASVFNEEFEGKFDRVLCDVPCSGLGIIRKKPEIKWARSENDIKELAIIQYKILQNAARYVKPGGVLVYSTCTLLKEENEDIVNQFLIEHSKEFETSSVDEFLPKVLRREIDNKHPEHYITIYPNLNNIDGFFIARFIRRM